MLLTTYVLALASCSNSNPCTTSDADINGLGKDTAARYLYSRVSRLVAVKDARKMPVYCRRASEPRKQAFQRA